MKKNPTKQLAKLKRGDMDAMNFFYNRFYAFICTFLLHLTSDETAALNLSNSTFEKVLRNCKEIENEQDLFALLCRTATRLFRQSIEGPDDGSEPPDESPEYHQIMIQVFRGLSPRRKTVMEMLHIRGLTIKDIAKALDITEQTVRNHLSESLGFLLNQTSCGEGHLAPLFE